jgi:hypothetical protein
MPRVKAHVFAFTSPRLLAYPSLVAKTLPPITPKRCRVRRLLRLDRRASARDFCFVTSPAGYSGLFERGADASHLYAVPLERATGETNPLERVVFVITDRGVEAQ